MSEDLLKKIKEGLSKSSFPLEIKIGKELEGNGWHFSTSTNYLDFESGKLREIDISASKMINGIAVKLIVECKKSSDKQLVLYSPNVRKYKRNIFFWSWLKAFPNPYLMPTPERGPLHDILDEFQKLKLFDLDVHFSHNIIFTKGDKILQDNQSFFSSLNSIIKHSIGDHSTLKELENKRRMVFYVLVIDGKMIEFKPSSDSDSGFNLDYINYGQYQLNYKFNILPEYLKTYQERTNKYGENYIIEFMNPDYFTTYIKELENAILNFDKDKLEKWGEEWNSE